MDMLLIQKLRECAVVPGKEETWIARLEDNKLMEIFARVKNGESAKSIARNIQQAWNIKTSGVHALSQGILKFKRRCSHLVVSPTPQRETPQANQCKDEIVNSEDSLESLDCLARLQRDRIKKILDEEKRSGIKYPHLSKDVLALAALEKLLIRLKTFSMFHDDPVKQSRLAGLEKQIAQKFNAAMDDIGEEGRVKIVNFLDRFMELAQENSEQVEIGPDGKWRLVEPKK